SLAKMFTKRRTLPVSSQMRSLIPGNCVSRLVISSPTVPPVAATSSLPLVSLRSGVGIRTVAMSSLLFWDLYHRAQRTAQYAVEVRQPGPDQLRPGQLLHQRVLRLQALPGDAHHHRPVVLADPSLGDEAPGGPQGDAASGLGEHALGLGQ